MKLPLFLVALLLASRLMAAEPLSEIQGLVAARSFVDQAQIVSKYTTELYAHQSTLKIVRGFGYAGYQCNETTPEENKKGQLVRVAIFNLLNPTATARWIDVCAEDDSSGGLTVAGFTAACIVHVIDDTRLRFFFTTRAAGDSDPLFRILYRDYEVATGALSPLHQARCTVAQKPGEVLDLAMPAVQRHLSFLFGAGVGQQFAKGINSACDLVRLDGQLYSTVQIKNSANGVTQLLTNVLMRSADEGATWELLGAPDPRLLPGDERDVKILAEPALSYDARNLYLHLRSNRRETGYLLSKAVRSDPYHFDPPVMKWGYGIGRPTIGDFGKPIGLVGLFTAPTAQLGGAVVSRNKCDVVLIDPAYEQYRLAFSIVDYNAVNTPFLCAYQDELYVSYTTGRRRLTPKFGTSEIVFTKLRREYFLPGK